MSSPPSRRRAPELSRRLPRVLIGIALALPVMLVVGVLVGSQVVARRTAPAPPDQRLALPAVPTPESDTADCQRLVSGLSTQLVSDGRLLLARTLAAPAPPGTVAWGGLDAAIDPVVLRCGVAAPPQLTPTSPVVQVGGVRWFALPAGDDATTYYTADRAVTVALTLPAAAGTGPLQSVSQAISLSLVSRVPG